MLIVIHFYTQHTIKCTHDHTQINNFAPPKWNDEKKLSKGKKIVRMRNTGDCGMKPGRQKKKKKKFQDFINQSIK